MEYHVRLAIVILIINFLLTLGFRTFIRGNQSLFGAWYCAVITETVFVIFVFFCWLIGSLL